MANPSRHPGPLVAVLPQLARARVELRLMPGAAQVVDASHEPPLVMSTITDPLRVRVVHLLSDVDGMLGDLRVAGIEPPPQVREVADSALRAWHSGNAEDLDAAVSVAEAFLRQAGGTAGQALVVDATPLVSGADLARAALADALGRRSVVIAAGSGSRRASASHGPLQPADAA